MTNIDLTATATFFGFIGTFATLSTSLKWTNISEKKYSLRSITNKDLKGPKKLKLKCLGFTYNGAKFFNMLPIQIRETENPNKYLKKYDKRFDMEDLP